MDIRRRGPRGASHPVTQEESIGSLLDARLEKHRRGEEPEIRMQDRGCTTPQSGAQRRLGCNRAGVPGGWRKWNQVGNVYVVRLASGNT